MLKHLPSDAPAQPPKPTVLHLCCCPQASIVVVVLGYRSSLVVARRWLSLVLGQRRRQTMAHAGGYIPKAQTARQPMGVPPFANGPPLKEWPHRVAVIAQGQLMTYFNVPVVIKTGKFSGTSSSLTITSPFEMRQWADGNLARVPTLRRLLTCWLASCFLLVVCHVYKYEHVAAPHCRLGPVNVAPGQLGKRPEHGRPGPQHEE